MDHGEILRNGKSVIDSFHDQTFYHDCSPFGRLHHHGCGGSKLHVPFQR